MEQICRDDEWIVDESSLTTVSFLGRGNFGCVVSLEEDSNSKLWAKKSSPMHLKNILDKELRIMHRFRDHPRIVNASTTMNLQTKRYECYTIYTEYASQGNLNELIYGSPRRSQPIPESLVQRAARMILEGLVALHSHGYVHCNLKPSNVFVFPSTTTGEPWDLKLAGFGSSKEPDSEYDSMSFGTAAKYLPPESFAPNEVIIHPDLDIYALGCVVYEMFGAIPIPEPFDEFYEWILRGRDISSEARDFLRLCRDIHPSRPTAADLLNHPFITRRLELPTTEEDKEISSSLLPSELF
ncbi:PREDICTED: mitogen-activated protein kinase kinase kinase 2-like [Camelina sativa]|uniref:Mitogen-activated protein kinase kinase kinase 2-like n=1 Tax=Camelina sativa TaxID=90675 RepID=A0ABM0Z0T6_CAMSA|nr:PREDICTED: mitogen-activated protein kinase kinase kinase 2-like [Camelina sativa]